MLDGVRFFFIFNCLLQIEFLSQLISEYWNRTTTLIPFLQAITHFCNFIPSNFMEGFTFLIDDTSYFQVISTISSDSHNNTSRKSSRRRQPTFLYPKKRCLCTVSHVQKSLRDFCCAGWLFRGWFRRGWPLLRFFYKSNNTNHAFSAIFSKIFVSIQLVHFTFRYFSFSEHNGRRRLSIRTPRFTFLSLL